MNLTFWGTSDAQGVPRMMCQCSTCTAALTMNVRKRPSLAFGHGKNKVLIDVSPDFRTQFLQYGELQPPQTVLITHAHHDHIGGLGDFADLCLWNGLQAHIVSPPDVTEDLIRRYPYLERRTCLRFTAATEWEVAGWRAKFHRVNHGRNGFSYAIVFERNNQRWAYASDAFDMTEGQMSVLGNCDLLILGTSLWDEQAAERSRRSVYDVGEGLELGRKLSTKQLVFTHLSHDIDSVEKSRHLPSYAQFAHDGMKLEI
jgi:phosphoribosyl 1,2-cyclic phosphate phosphodiesterase